MAKTGSGSKANLLAFVKSKSAHPEPTIRTLVSKVIELLSTTTTTTTSTSSLPSNGTLIKKSEGKNEPINLINKVEKSDFVLDCINELASINLEFKTAWDLFENATKWQVSRKKKKKWKFLILNKSRIESFCLKRYIVTLSLQF